MQHQRKTVAVILRSCAREKSYARSPHRVSVIRFRRSIFSVFSTHTESAQKNKKKIAAAVRRDFRFRPQAFDLCELPRLPAACSSSHWQLRGGDS